MPGSTTIAHTHWGSTIAPDDARRLASVLHELARLLRLEGPNRLTDAQVAALCGGRTHRREEFTHWVEDLTRGLDHRA
ncbi:MULTISPECIES: hypothetical protein [Streptomyces]|uniref:Uncharacterized protein n=1 Tax=Streptomyces chengmaiensis TaxID=3040919 RepID=A0ABT6HWK1_9ACTN|nr:MULTISPECIES: hypothetical protein [Streptomyces]MDH2392673.1 hypothetical protein [Streptomyces chengmaiensis]WRQ81066.1 hypothetical protein I3F59_017880 [Streptomyces sp. MUM 178J]